MNASYCQLRALFRVALKTQHTDDVKACQDMLSALFPTPPFNTPVTKYDNLLQLGLAAAVRAQQHTFVDQVLDFYITQTHSVTHCLPRASHVTQWAVHLNDRRTIDKIIERLDVAFVSGDLVAKKDLDLLKKFHQIIDHKEKNENFLHNKQQRHNVEMSRAVDNDWLEGVDYLIAANAYDPDLVLEYCIPSKSIKCFEHILPKTSPSGCTKSFVSAVLIGRWYRASVLWERMDVPQLDYFCQKQASSFSVSPSFDMAVRKICQEWSQSTAIPASLEELSRLGSFDHCVHLTDQMFLDFSHKYPEFRFAALFGAVNLRMARMWIEKITDNEFIKPLLEYAHDNSALQYVAEILQKRFNQLEHEAISQHLNTNSSGERTKKM